MDKKLESEFKNRLEKETEEITELKEETWNNISRELFPEKDKKTRTNWMKGFVAVLGTVAVAAIMFFVFVTGDFTDETQNDPTQDEVTEGANDPDTEGNDIGENTEDNEIDNEPPLKDRFPHEKEVVIEMEGMKQPPIQAQLATNDEWRYIIYFDKDGYQFIPGEEMDEIIFSKELDEGYPEVGMEIQHFTGTTTEEITEHVIGSLAHEEMDVTREDLINWPIDAVMIQGIGDRDEGFRDAPVHRYYITEDENDSFFVFKQKFFTEAWEGHALRFDYMLESFEIVK